MQICKIFFWIIVCITAKSQTSGRIQYFDSEGKAVFNPKSATYYRTIEETEETFIVRDYYLSGNVKMVASCSSVEPEVIREGKCIQYFENGSVKEEGTYEEDEPEGIHRHYFENGNPRKEILHEGDEQKHIQWWLEDGTPLLANGSGIVHEPHPHRTEAMLHLDIESSKVIASFSTELNSPDTIYTCSDILPQYTGGSNAMTRELQSYMSYPRSARRENIEGTVYIQFIIDTSGHATGCKTLRGIHPECDAVAMTAVCKLQRWIPGKHRGKPVLTRYVVPVRFRLK